jgi:predicted dehydrogenase
LAKRYGDIAVYTNYQEMLKREKPDLVSVCASTSAHYQILKYILKHSAVKYILAEKPLTEDIEETKEIISLAKKKKACIFVNYLRRWDKTVSEVRKKVLSGKLGKYLFGSFVYYGGFKNNAVHLLDLLLSLGLEFTFQNFITVKRNLGKDFSGSVWFKTKEGRPINFYWIDEKDYTCLEANLFFERGKIQLGDWTDARLYGLGRAIGFPQIKELKHKQHLPVTICTAMRHSTQNIIEHFKKDKITYASLEAELKIAQIISEIKKKVKYGK